MQPPPPPPPPPTIYTPSSFVPISVALPRVDDSLWDQDDAVIRAEPVPISIQSTDGQKRSLKVVCISDTHEQAFEWKWKIPNGDILVHAGDFCRIPRDSSKTELRCILAGINSFFAEMPHRHKVYCAGNHETAFNYIKNIQEHLPAVHYLQDSGVTLDGINFWGSPWTGSVHMAFSANRHDRKIKWDMIPSDVTFLITHMPPHSILDLACSKRPDARVCDVCGGRHPLKKHWGCAYLLDAVTRRIQPAVHVFGHAHDSPGTRVVENTLFCNASLPLVNSAIVLDVDVA